MAGRNLFTPFKRRRLLNSCLLYTSGDPQSDSFVLPFKNLINDSYCKDISMKLRSRLEVKQKSGEFVGSFAPYGYMKSPENKNQLIVRCV